MNPSRNTCGYCAHYVKSPETSVYGACFRYPPLPTASGVKLRPVMGEDERPCGEFELTIEKKPGKVKM